jgi:hypothetical protein
MSFVEQLPQKGSFKPKGKPRGRPVGWRKQKPDEQVKYTTIRMNLDLKNYFESVRLGGEKIDQTIARILKEKTEKIQTLDQENDRFKTLLQTNKIIMPNHL